MNLDNKQLGPDYAFELLARFTVRKLQYEACFVLTAGRFITSEIDATIENVKPSDLFSMQVSLLNMVIEANQEIVGEVQYNLTEQTILDEKYVAKFEIDGDFHEIIMVMQKYCSQVSIQLEPPLNHNKPLEVMLSAVHICSSVIAQAYSDYADEVSRGN